jgi:hypothetical protein
MTKLLSTLVLSLTLVFTSACSIITSNANNDIQSMVNEIWEQEVYFPTLEQYPIGIIYAEHRPILKDGEKVPDGEGPWMIQFMYFSEDEKSKTGNKQIDDWKENDTLQDFIYEDNYKNQLRVGLTIKKQEIDSVHPDNVDKEIDGHKVLYYVGPARDEGDFAYIGINFDHLDYGYSIMYRIDENKSEEDAIAFAQEIIKNNK